MANSNPVWHNIFRKIVLKPDNITFEAETYNDTINILRGSGVSWVGVSDEDTALATGNDTFMIDVDYDISIPLATTDLTLEDVNGNTSVVTFTAGRGVEIVRNSAQELEWRSFSVTETDTLQTVTERNNITNNKIFVNNIEVGTISSSFTEDGFPSYDAGHDLVGDGTLDNPLTFSPWYEISIVANSTDQFEFTALGPGTLSYSAGYVFDLGATAGSVTLEREDPSSPGSWTVLDIISGFDQGHSYAIQGIYSELYSGNVNYRLTYSWTNNASTVTWFVQNTFEGGAYSPINNPQLKTDTDAKTVDINDLQFFQNNIRTTVSNMDIVLDPHGTGKVTALSNITAPTFTGDLTGNVNGNVTGDITGNVISTNTSLTVLDTSSATAIFTGNVTGNADTVTNGVYTSGSYADPSWITSLDASKIIGSIQLSDITIDGDLRLFDNVISTTLSNSDIVLDPNGTGKVRSFSNIVAPGFEGDLTGNADTVTDGVYTSGSYSDPSWITSLDYSKISSPDSLSITATGTITARSLATRFAQVFDVKDFGATGDGTTNDYTAIAAAITAAGAVTEGAVVLFANGVFATNSTLSIPQKVTIKIQSATIKPGSGFTAANTLISLDAGDLTHFRGYGACIEGESPANSIVEYTGTGYAISVTTPGPNAIQGCQANIKDIKVVGSASGTAGIYYNFVTGSITENVTVTGFTNGDGIYHNSSFVITHYNLQSLGNKRGIHNYFTNAICLIGGLLVNNTQYGWWDEYYAGSTSKQNSITNSVIENNGSGANTAHIRLSFSYMFSLTNTYFENVSAGSTPAYDIWIDNNSYGINISSNIFINAGANPTYTIYNQAGFACTVDNNLCLETCTAFYYQETALQYNKVVNNFVADNTTAYFGGSDSNNDTLVLGQASYFGTPNTLRNGQGPTANGYGFNHLSGYGTYLTVRTRTGETINTLWQNATSARNIAAIYNDGTALHAADANGAVLNATNINAAPYGIQVAFENASAGTTYWFMRGSTGVSPTYQFYIYTDGSYRSLNGAIGYGTGAGAAAAVTGTGVSQTVTINKSCGTIACATAAGSTTIKTVTVTNSVVAIDDTIVISARSGGSNAYSSYVYAVANGSFKFDYTSPTGVTNETPRFNFAIIKSVSA